MATQDTFGAGLNVGYLVHDVDDAAVTRRVLMLEHSGCRITLCGFTRNNTLTEQRKGAYILGTTRDAALLQRAMAVLKCLVFRAALKAKLASCDVLIARNLEMLILAHSIKQGRPVIYECLDIHKTLLSASPATHFIRTIEDKLVRASNAIITSSPGFIRNYFEKKSGFDVNIALFENKVLSFDKTSKRPFLAKPSPPWTVGWFGMLRCKRTFDTLAQLSADMNGSLKVLIAGKPSLTELPNFYDDVKKHAYMEYVGPYKPSELNVLYSRCHFAWCIDWFEEGLNSAWLLPNRIYEASAQTVVAVALANVETGIWLRQRNAGFLINNDISEFKISLKSMTTEAYKKLQKEVLSISDSDIFATDEECYELRNLLELER
jgi:succinoglycan biosynthesis protein ExoL